MQPEENKVPLLSDQDSDEDLWLFAGAGFLISIAFLDPGNLEGDLQTGAIACYSLLWLLMWATAMGLLVQLLAARLGVATGKHLAELCSEEYPTWARRVFAIAIKILSNGALPLWAGVLITASDCFIFLFLENYGVRKLEAFFAVLIATMAVSFAWMFGETKPSGTELLHGDKLGSIAVGVVGCIIMPHNVFLHSALVQHFAGQYLEEKYGGGLLPILYIWAIGLLAAGQSSTITGTYAGQFIMGGFLKLKLKKWVRALITRSCAIIPTIIVALVFDSSEAALDTLNKWLNVLQSIQIPFALIPLLCLVSKEQIMGAFRIGHVLKTVAWIVAALVIVITGFLLLNFFSSEVSGLMFTSSVCLYRRISCIFSLPCFSRLFDV
ncbi:hypothetical protein ES319_A12G077600v1 [Gossypium barbadense]|uniref:Metal transporter n=1 Tax=Gossypium barbadense TaxID=3634 RepID=A0A5J5TD61_GOSBA|nr:hypothetical protein ES319_A12G077600v1 [Gossypium barbadense]